MLATDERLTNAARTATNHHIDDATVWFVSDFGSRATGLNHDGSDHDLFCVFDQPSINYKLHDETMAFNEAVDVAWTDDSIDVQGHSTVKFVDALGDADPMCTEALRSDERHYLAPSVTDQCRELETLVEEQMERVGLFYHYRSFAESNFRQYVENGNDPTYHRWAQVCRAALSATYIRTTGELPPLDVWRLLHEVALSLTINDMIHGVFMSKARGDGDDEYHAPTELRTWIEEVVDTDMAHDRYDYGGIDRNRGRGVMQEIDSRL